jgi:hypothetical protein
MNALRAAVCGVALTALSGCAGVSVYDDDARVAAVSYSDPSPPSLTLYTMVNNRSGAGAHTSLLIDASETVLFDPAGSFKHSLTAERNDVLFGITPRVERDYRQSHARASHHVVIQEIPVTAEQAEIAYRAALKAGPVPGAYCASATSAVLRQVPGFENIVQTMYPVTLSESFGARPGVKTEKLYENDDETIDEAVAKLQ